jgi:hypothetical protein
MRSSRTTFASPEQVKKARRFLFEAANFLSSDSHWMTHRTIFVLALFLSALLPTGFALLMLGCRPRELGSKQINRDHLLVPVQLRGMLRCGSTCG